MTSSDQIAVGPLTAISRSRYFAIELAETLKLAVPIALTQLGQIAMMTTDIAMIGRLGAEAVATPAQSGARAMSQPGSASCLPPS